MKFHRLLPIALLASAALLLPVVPAAAEGRVEIALTSDASAPVLAAANAPTELTLKGSGFQSVANGFGGIYVMFGWVDPSAAWQPSAGGVTGQSYRYANDDESAPAGYQQFIAFPGSATAAEASGGEISAEGTWTTTVTVPAAQFESFDRDGNALQVDCLATSCGVITIGAHGVANAANETFTPVAFGADTIEEATTTPEPMMTTMAEPTTPADATASESSSGSVLPIAITSGVGAAAIALAIAGVVTRRRRRARS